MAEKARHAFGTLEKVDSALTNGTIDAYDILFLKDANGKPYVGWIDKDGNKVICENTAELSALEAKIDAKADVDAVQTMVDSAVETAVEEAIAVEVVEF